MAAFPQKSSGVIRLYGVVETHSVGIGDAEVSVQPLRSGSAFQPQLVFLKDNGIRGCPSSNRSKVHRTEPCLMIAHSTQLYPLVAIADLALGEEHVEGGPLADIAHDY